eukprot:gnl/MRDRNA2_/MRDRNA2_25516_c0_seq1.p1 gnl/MRDRNA2_/MRDRNA2_25516_c0~~gnl/MRDRNA2_/MRDRNA2_25516_c0_seq1.p1  ORF type:complete len:364 (-),score=56.10 gnl/MRDRNA2_/MRDRNA2_25516_c0_seq1:63-1154(-)
MDIEAFEWNVLPEMLVNAKDLLPDQIGFELHKSPVAGGMALGWKKARTVWEIALFGELMFRAGYLPIHRRDNVFGEIGEATEFLIAKVGSSPHINADTPVYDVSTLIATQPPTLPTYIPLWWAATLPTRASCADHYGQLDARQWSRGGNMDQDYIMIFVLTLECGEKRMAEIDSRIKKLDFNFMVIEAVDGFRISKTMVPVWPCTSLQVPSAFQSWYLSNMKAFEAFLTLKAQLPPVSPTEWLLVVEDSILLPSNFTEELQMAASTLPEATVIFMGRDAHRAKPNVPRFSCCQSIALYHESVVHLLVREMDYHIPKSYANKAAQSGLSCTQSGFMAALLEYLNVTVATHQIYASSMSEERLEK